CGSPRGGRNLVFGFGELRFRGWERPFPFGGPRGGTIRSSALLSPSGEPPRPRTASASAETQHIIRQRHLLEAYPGASPIDDSGSIRPHPDHPTLNHLALKHKRQADRRQWGCGGSVRDLE